MCCVHTQTKKSLTKAAARVILLTVSRKSTNPTMTKLLREALGEAESLYSVAQSTGVQKASLIRFLRADQSLRLDMADKLAAYFGIESHRPKRKR